MYDYIYNQKNSYKFYSSVMHGGLGLESLKRKTENSIKKYFVFSAIQVTRQNLLVTTIQRTVHTKHHNYFLF